jgi:osmotically-inducible protein OsmY
MSFKKYLLSLVALSSILCACSTPPSFANLNVDYSTNEENITRDDLAISKKIQDKIEVMYPGSEVKVNSNHFNILVLGEVKTQKVKDGITSFVKAQPSVKKVWNYTTINAIPDFKINKDLVVDVKKRIMNEKNINTNNIVVEAVGDKVYLVGTDVGNLTYFARAIRGINSMEGVSKVINLTELGPDDYSSEEERDF